MNNVNAGANLYDALRNIAQVAAGRLAIQFQEQRITYGSMFRCADAMADWLDAVGISAGDRVSFLSYNRPEILELYLAVAKIGAVLAPINPELAPGEIAYVLDHAQPKIVFCEEKLKPRLEPAMAGRADRIAVRLLPHDESCRTLPSVASAAPKVPTSKGGGSDGLVICYTSGSTGRPKGIYASHRVEIASADAYRRIWHVGPSDRMLIALPLAYLYGLTTAGLTALYSGATIILLERFHPASVTDAIEKEGATIFMGVPTMFGMLSDYAESTGRWVSSPGFRLAISAGAPLSSEIAQRFRDGFGLSIQEFYALSEIRPVFAFDSQAREVRPPGCVGRPGPDVEVRLIGEDGEPVETGKDGDLLVRSPTLMLGYYRDPELTAEVIRDGWFFTGDRAKCDREGRYYIVGRVKDLIIRGGAKIAPAEVEATLMRHPAIREVAVVGVPDSLFGETVKAAIVLKAGTRLSAEEVRSYCAGKLADYKTPAHIVFMDRLPTGPTGKVLKRAIIEAE